MIDDCFVDGCSYLFSGVKAIWADEKDKGAFFS